MVQVENKTLQWFGASLDASSSAADTTAIVVVRLEQFSTSKLGVEKPTHLGKMPTHSRHFAQTG